MYAQVLRQFVVDPNTMVASEGKAQAWQYEGELWSTNSRIGGRRFVVRGVEDRDGKRVVLFDTDSCYDEGNAVNSLCEWLGKQLEEKKRKPVMSR